MTPRRTVFWMGGREETTRLVAVDVVLARTRQMAAVGSLVESELPVAHLETDRY